MDDVVHGGAGVFDEAVALLDPFDAGGDQALDLFGRLGPALRCDARRRQGLLAALCAAGRRSAFGRSRPGACSGKPGPPIKPADDIPSPGATPSGKPPMSFNDLKISTRLALGFATLAALFLLMGALSMAKITAVDRLFDKVMHEQYPKVASMVVIKDNVNVTARAMRNAVLLSDPAETEKEAQRVYAARKAIGAEVDRLATQIRSENGKKGLSHLLQVRTNFVPLQDKVIEPARLNKDEEASAFLLSEVRPAQTAYFEAIDDLTKVEVARMNAAVDEAAAASSTLKTATLAGGAIALVTALLLALWTIRSITRPINQAVAISNSVAAGDLSVDFDASGKTETAQ